MSADDAENKRKEKERQYKLLCGIDVDDVWKQVDYNKEKIGPVVDVHPGWKTVRIFVSSTFKDFHQEREILVKKVFADLRIWCEERQLHLIDCDLRWGVPKETTSELTLRTCLEEIDRCYEYNKAPYFLNMTCKRVGWIPLDEELPKNLLKKYNLVFGFSVTEMEIVHAAYRIENPNALFLIRDESFLDEIEDKSIKDQFVDELQPKAEEKLQVLWDKITSCFPEDRVIKYKCTYDPKESLYFSYAPNNAKPKLNLDPEFSEKVFNFFKERIEQQYPHVEMKVDAFLESKYNHEAFMRSRCESGQRVDQRSAGRQEMIIGREEVVEQIDDYIEHDKAGYPKLIVGEAGAGKSSIMAKVTSDTLEKMEKKGNVGWKVFFHFVGAVPRSTSLSWILKRLLKELDPNADFPEKLQDIAALVSIKLATGSTPIVIFIDALNQIDKETRVEQMFWLPEKLSSNVRCVLSLISDSEPHRALRNRRNFQQQMEIQVPDLKPSKWHEIVSNYLVPFNKTLDKKQLFLLMDKNSSKNPLWLRIACEELRVYGDFQSIDEFIWRIKDGLPQLLQQVLERFALESDKVIVEATLCLLEVSQFGLLEIELLEILADKDHLEYNEVMAEESPEKCGDKEKLPYVEWASVYRNLRTFLRPYGNPREGRLSFYHKSLSEVVQNMYLDKQKSDSEYHKKLFWWHKKLVDFYRNSGTYDRKVEEYPHHLLFLKQHASSEAEARRYCTWLQEFLVNMEVFERLYDDEFSADLLFYWRESGDDYYDQMCKQYLDLSKVIEKGSTPSNCCLKFEQFSHLMIQAGRCEEALQLAKKCLEIMEDPSNEMERREEKLMYLYSHVAHIKSSTQKEKGIAEFEEIIDWHEKAIQIIIDSKQPNDPKFKNYRALQLNKMAHARSEIYRLLKDQSALVNLFRGKKPKDVFIEGMKEIEESIKIYKELNDYGHELEAQITKADLHRGNKDEQLKIYKDTSERCRQIFGEAHPLMCRISYNTAIAYERAGDANNAYTYFRKAFDLGSKVFGLKHSTTEMYRSALKEKDYAAIGKRLGQTVD